MPLLALLIPVAALPRLDAFLNGASAIFLLAGYAFIRSRRVLQHKICMLSAVACSAGFLVSYLYFHAHAGLIRFSGQGTVRPVYFTILVSHTILAAVIVPLVLITLYFALRSRFSSHRAIARWTLPIWLYVSITGVLVYYLLFVLYKPIGFSSMQNESVRDQLALSETKDGSAIASFYSGITILSFKDRAVVNGQWSAANALNGVLSRDGSLVAAEFTGPPRFLGVATSEGANIRALRGIPAALEICWSYDKSKLAVVSQKFDYGASPPNSTLETVDLSSGDTQQIDVRPHITSQCWSPDGSQIVYEAEDQVRLFDVKHRLWRVIAKGVQPTWSPDGKWIAFLDEHTYWAIQPSGEARKVLFEKSNAASGLYWSPDSRFVAYTTLVGLADLLQGVVPPLDAEVYHLWVRRLGDNSEESLPGNWGTGGFQWIENQRLVRELESAAMAH